MTIGERIKKLRKKHNLTQKQFAEKLHVTTSCICDIEKDRRNPSLWLAITMAHKFNISLDKLFIK